MVATLVKAPSTLTPYRKIALAYIPVSVFLQLESGKKNLHEEATAALSQGIRFGLPNSNLGKEPLIPKMIGLSLWPAELELVVAVAKEHFDGDVRAALGWFICRGVGRSYRVFQTLGTFATSPYGYSRPITLKSVQQRDGPASGQVDRPPSPNGPTTYRFRTPRTPVVPESDEGIPTGLDFRARREAIGLSQREFVDRYLPFKRGMYSNVERGVEKSVRLRRIIDQGMSKAEADHAAKIN